MLRRGDGERMRADDHGSITFPRGALSSGTADPIAQNRILAQPSTILQAKRLKQKGTNESPLLPALPFYLLLSSLLDVFPMPRLVKVRAKAEACSVAHEPLINRCLNLDGAV